MKASKQQFRTKSGFYLASGLVFVFSFGLLLTNTSATPKLSTHPVIVPRPKQAIKPQTISGKPVLLRIPDLKLELPIDEGHYNPADASWTLSGYHAQYAMPTLYANNQEGNTLVYGHNNRHVFGPLKNLQPGMVAEVVTENKHQFFYTFEASTTIQPYDVSIFEYEGTPILTLQTCTGNWHELRTMSTFRFSRVVKYNPNAEKERIDRENLFNSLQSLTNPSYPGEDLIE